jgi:cytochrome c oxidase subunit 3
MNTVRVNPTASIGFLISMGAWSVTFITLIGGYAVYRLRTGYWLTDYITPDVFVRAMANTAFLIISSFILKIFLRERKPILFWMGALGGGFFLVGQWGLWQVLLRSGLTMTQSLAGSFFYLLTGFHAVHIVIGLLFIMPFGMALCNADCPDKALFRFEFALKFWDLLMWFWLVLLVLIFILK